MYKCNVCGGVTDELPTVRELIDGENYETYTDSECVCGGEFDDAEHCKVCHDWICGNETHHGLCADCAASVREYFLAFKCKLNDAEWNYLRDYIEEEDL